jgi:hypothetical protein
MKTTGKRSIAGWVFFGTTVALLLVQAVSLFERGRKGESDVGVFYRTALLLKEGASGEIYAQRDSVTGWPISIPPAGMALFQPLASLDRSWSTAVWAVFNVLVALAAVCALRKLCDLLDDERLRTAFPWLAGMFLLLAGGSVQVGQFSSLFVACWLFALLAASSGKVGLQAFLWAAPSAIKLYPALLFASPLSTKCASKWKTILWFFVALFALAFFVPFLFYGPRTWGLNVSFFNEIVLDTGGRLKWMQALGTTANQSLDAVLIRYLSWYPKFHQEYTYVPTARIDLDTVRVLGHVVRAVILAVTVTVVAKFRKRSANGLLDLLLTAALWSSTLYAVLPETRARYAVYAFFGFVPLAMIATEGTWKHRASTVAVFLLVMGLIPKPLEVLGIGYLGTLALWVVNLRLLSREESWSRPQESHSRPTETTLRAGLD